MAGMQSQICLTNGGSESGTICGSFIGEITNDPGEVNCSNCLRMMEEDPAHVDRLRIGD